MEPEYCLEMGLEKGLEIGLDSRPDYSRVFLLDEFLRSYSSTSTDFISSSSTEAISEIMPLLLGLKARNSSLSTP